VGASIIAGETLPPNLLDDDIRFDLDLVLLPALEMPDQTLWS
jgi:hypothetical protein